MGMLEQLPIFAQSAVPVFESEGLKKDSNSRTVPVFDESEINWKRMDNQVFSRIEKCTGDFLRYFNGEI